MVGQGRLNLSLARWVGEIPKVDWGRPRPELGRPRQPAKTLTAQTPGASPRADHPSITLVRMTTEALRQ
jgi:hypothetical protein